MAQTQQIKLTVMYCPDHDIEIHLFCCKCNCLVCALCIPAKHQEHTLCDIRAIHKKKLALLSEQNCLIDDKLLPFFTEENRKLDAILESHEEHYELEKKKIQDHYMNMKEVINRFTKKMLDELEIHWKKTKKEIKTCKISINDLISTLKKGSNRIPQIQVNENIQTVCHLSDKIVDFVSKVDISSKALPRQSLTYIHGKISEKAIVSMIGNLQNTRLPDTAEIRLKLDQSCVTDLHAVDKAITRDCVWITNTEDALLQEIRLEEKRAVIKQQYVQICVNDFALTKSGNLLLALEGNHAVKIWRNAGKIEDFYSFDPSNKLKKPQIPVALHFAEINQIIVGTMEKGWRKETPTQEWPRQITILSIKAELIEAHEYDKARSWVFTFPYRITTNKSGDIIILDKLADNNGRIVATHVVQKHIEIKWIYSGINNLEIFDPWDIVITPHDNVIICDPRCHALHILNCEGHIITKESLSPLDIYYPCSMSITKEGLLFIGCKKEYRKNAMIHILKFKGC